MSSRKALILAVSAALLIAALLVFVGRPPWPGSGDHSKDRTDNMVIHPPPR